MILNENDDESSRGMSPLGDAPMARPGEYRPDSTEGVTRVEDLPASRIELRSRNFKHRRCPDCEHSSYRHRVFERRLHDLGNLADDHPVELRITYSQHRCSRCRKYFNADLTDLADPHSHYTRRVVHLAVRVVVEDGLPYRAASWHLWRDHRVFVPWATIQNWVEATGEKIRRARKRALSR